MLRVQRTWLRPWPDTTCQVACASLITCCCVAVSCRCHFNLPSVEAEEETHSKLPPIKVKFEIPYFTVSGMQVRSQGGWTLEQPACSLRAAHSSSSAGMRCSGYHRARCFGVTV